MFEHEMEESKKVSLFVYLFLFSFPSLTFCLIILQKPILLVHHNQRPSHLCLCTACCFSCKCFPDVSFLHCLLVSKYISYLPLGLKSILPISRLIFSPAVCVCGLIHRHLQNCSTVPSSCLFSKADHKLQFFLHCFLIWQSC